MWHRLHWVGRGGAVVTKKTYTVMVVGGAHQEVRRLTIRRLWLSMAGLIAITILIAGFSLSVHYLALSQGTFAAQSLQTENGELKERLQALRGRKQGVCLGHHDVQCLALEELEPSNGEAIAACLERLAGRIGRIRRIVADHGSDVKSGIARCLGNATRGCALPTM